MKTIINTQDDRLAVLAAQTLVDEVHDILEHKQQCVLGIVGGSSVVGLFVQLSKNREMPWDKIHIFMVDERLVPLEDEQSNYRLARESFLDALLAHGLINQEQLHPFVYDAQTSDYGVKTFKQELKQYGGQFDIVILSSGEDGHCAALFPNHNSIDNDSTTFLTMEDSPKPPAKRMSSSRSLLQGCTAAFALFMGERKHEAYKLFSKQDTTIQQCPIVLVKDIERGYVITNISDT